MKAGDTLVYILYAATHISDPNALLARVCGNIFLKAQQLALRPPQLPTISTAGEGELLPSQPRPAILSLTMFRVRRPLMNLGIFLREITWNPPLSAYSDHHDNDRLKTLIDKNGFVDVDEKKEKLMFFASWVFSNSWSGWFVWLTTAVHRCCSNKEGAIRFPSYSNAQK